MKRSPKKVKLLEDVILPYKVVFPVDVEGSVNGIYFKFKKNEPSEINTFSIYQALVHSSYGRYLED